MKSIKQVLTKFNPFEDKYISREFQTFGIHLSEKLQDDKHKALYIRLAKQHPRAVLEEALRFVVDSNARNKAALFMWKLKDLGAWKVSSKAIRQPADENSKENEKTKA